MKFHRAPIGATLFAADCREQPLLGHQPLGTKYEAPPAERRTHRHALWQ